MAPDNGNAVRNRLTQLYRDFKDDGDVEALLLLYYYGCLVTGDTEPNMAMLPTVCDLYGFDYDTRLWMAWLWGNFNTLPPCLQVAEEFPHPTKVRRSEFAAWDREHGMSLVYAGDRVYVKGHLLEMYDSYMEMLGGRSQLDFLSDYTRSSNKVENFRRLWPKVMALRGFGTYSAYEMTEVLYRCCGLPLVADRVFFKAARSPRAGLVFVTENGTASRVISKSKVPTNSEAEAMEDQALTWVSQARDLFPAVWPDLWSLESALCTFKKCYGRRRYVGFLLDRSADELTKTEQTGAKLPKMWEARQRCFHPEYLVENRGGCGPEPERLNLLADHGELAGLDLDLLPELEPVYSRNNRGVFYCGEA